MSKKRNAPAPALPAPVDPTLPFTEIEIGGATYRMCFDLGALAQAETALIKQGYNVNLLTALPRVNMASTQIVFAASIHKFHPDVDFETALGLVTLSNVYKVADAINDAWIAAMPELGEAGVEQNPPPPSR